MKTSQFYFLCSQIWAVGTILCNEPTQVFMFVFCVSAAVCGVICTYIEEMDKKPLAKSKEGE